MTKNTSPSQVVENIILSQKILHKGTMFSIVSGGGELLFDDKFGLKIVKNKDFINLQLIVYSETPKFKLLKYTHPKNPRIYKTEQEKDTQLVLEKGGSIFDEM